MKIAIAASENHLKSPIDAHFGRCDWYCIFDTELRKAEFIENPFRHSTENAGSDAVEFLAEKEIKLVIAGRFGSRAVQAFREKNIQMIVPEDDKNINDFLQKLK